MSLSNDERQYISDLLKERFEAHMYRHENLAWSEVIIRLTDQKLRVLYQMELTGGEPDVIAWDKESGEYIFCDCSAETPQGRRNMCYDRQALDSRKENKPLNSVVEMAVEIGIELLTAEEYFMLQQFGPFDTKTSSWLKTPAEVRNLGGAIFGDFRYGRTFIYHNGAQSYYSSRGFRGLLRV